MNFYLDLILSAWVFTSGRSNVCFQKAFLMYCTNGWTILSFLKFFSNFSGCKVSGWSKSVAGLQNLAQFGGQQRKSAVLFFCNPQPRRGLCLLGSCLIRNTLQFLESASSRSDAKLLNFILELFNVGSTESSDNKVLVVHYLAPERVYSSFLSRFS